MFLGFLGVLLSVFGGSERSQVVFNWVSGLVAVLSGILWSFTVLARISAGHCIPAAWFVRGHLVRYRKCLKNDGLLYYRPPVARSFLRINQSVREIPPIPTSPSEDVCPNVS